MQCELILKQLDDYLDGELPQGERGNIDQHLQSCSDCRADYYHAQELIQQCQNLPAIKPRPGYERRMLHFLAQQPQSSRYFIPAWFAAGFSTAVAALLVVWFMVFDLTDPSLIDPSQDSLPVITVELPAMQSRKVDLVFNSPNSIQKAAMTIELPDGVEIAGYPKQRKLEWHTALKQGSNRLSLPIIIKNNQGGTLLARISHEGQTRTFKLNLVPIPSSSEFLPVLSS